MKTVLFLLVLFLSSTLFSQEKKQLGAEQYSEWKSLANIQQSITGNKIAYEINPGEGDGLLYVKDIKTAKETTFPRGTNSIFSPLEDFIVFSITPQYDTLRALKLIDSKTNKLPKDSLGIYYLERDSLIKIPSIKNFKVSEENNWLAYLSTTDQRIPCKNKKCLFGKKKNKCTLPKTSGTTLTIFNPTLNKEFNIHCVKEYEFDKTGSRLFVSLSEKGTADSLTIKIITLADFNEQTIQSKLVDAKKFTFNEAGTHLSFLGTLDTNKRRVFSLYLWSLETGADARVVVDSITPGMPLDWTVSEHSAPYFSKDGSKLFFGTTKIVRQEKKDTLLSTEKATLDIWSGTDKKLQSQQLIELKNEEKRTYLAVYHLDKNQFVQLADATVPIIRTQDKGTAEFVLGVNSDLYERERDWEYPWKSDYYKVDLTTGSKQLLKKGLAYQGLISPSGDYFVWYEGLDSAWYSKTPGIKTGQNLTKELKASFATNINGNTYIAESERSEGWIKIKGIEYLIVYSKNDIWALCPSDKNKTFSLTKGLGARNKTKYSLKQLATDSVYIQLPTTLVHATNRLTKDEAYLKIDPETFELTKLIESGHKYGSITKAKNSDALLFRRMNFIQYPEIESTDLTFTTIQRITDTNPQQNEYNWGTVEMVAWKSFNGLNLKGLLYKPENFDSTKSYPMITYFYETNSENIHLHYVPKPTASIVFPTEYVSNGYIIFIPDVKYTPGYPAKSAYDCIVSGTDYLTTKYAWIDSTRLGIQGQSWGGYQVAQLITMTTKYKAAMAGAPVSNMFSAYGGIRWSSGYSRMFQYERTQSRIGYTIWEKPGLYMENSPLFGLPNVKTPLLIMHNDGDGAVPWYQGIELFMGLRRLNQPVWLLNYNDDGHNLMIPANRKDLSIRMRQFFDYYLLDKPMPLWMEGGIPAIDKGKNYGLDLKK